MIKMVLVNINHLNAQMQEDMIYKSGSGSYSTVIIYIKIQISWTKIMFNLFNKTTYKTNFYLNKYEH